MKSGARAPVVCVAALSTAWAWAGGAPAGTDDRPWRSKDWPCWSGPETAFRAADSGVELVDDLNQARLVWRSEEVTPMGKAHAARSGQYSSGRHEGPAGQQGLPSGGGASPIVADGRVYLCYYLPAGDVVVPEIPGGRSFNRASRHVSADDVVLCLDAATGRTLWKQVFKDTGINLQDGKSPGHAGLTPCWWDGRVYAVGTTHRIWCLDGATGRVVWRSHIPGVHEQAEKSKREALAKRRMAASPGLGKSSGRNLIVAAGVLLVHAGTDLVGVDAGTGKVLWTLRNGAGRVATPTRWVHQGKTYVLTGNGNGEVRLLEPASGKVLWTITGLAPNHVTLNYEGDLLVVMGKTALREGEDPKRNRSYVSLLGCYRISPRKAEKVWIIEDWRKSVRAGDFIPIVVNGHVFAPLKEGEGRYRRVLCIDVRTGEVASKLDLPEEASVQSFVLAAEGRLIGQRDMSHMGTQLIMIDPDPRRPRLLGRTWVPPHPPTSGYVPHITHACVAGRLYIRGADGIYCYDLRKRPPGAPVAAPQR